MHTTAIYSYITEQKTDNFFGSFFFPQLFLNITEDGWTKNSFKAKRQNERNYSQRFMYKHFCSLCVCVMIIFFSKVFRFSSLPEIGFALLKDEVIMKKINFNVFSFCSPEGFVIKICVCSKFRKIFRFFVTKWYCNYIVHRFKFWANGKIVVNRPRLSVTRSLSIGLWVQY